MFTVTAKIQLYVPDQYRDILFESLQAYRNACNWLSLRVHQSKDLSQASLNKKHYYDIRTLFGLGSQMSQSVMKTVIARYRSAKSNGHEWTLVKFKKTECDLVWNRDYLLTKRDVFSVNTLDGRVKLDYADGGMSQYLDGSWKFGTAKIVFKRGKWFLHIPMSKEMELLQDSDVANVAGIDLGINFVAASYDSSGSTSFYPGREIKHKRARFAESRKAIQKRATPSSRRKLKSIGSRENRWMQDVNHRISKALVESQPSKTLFVLEDLAGVRCATEKVKLKNRYVQVSWAFHDLRSKIEDKAIGNGSKTIAMDPAHTSQTCPKCGHVNKGNRNKRLHAFRCCNCNYGSNDDRIGAMNLHRKGIEYLSAVAAG